MAKFPGVRPDAVAIYIRWSTEEQGEGTTLDVQKERCSLFVRSQGWEVRADLIFVDDGYSGASMERPGLTRLRQAIAGGLVTCVVTYRLDRLSRNLVDTVNLVRLEWVGTCIYRSATEGFDTSADSPTGGLIFNILASFAEFERAVITERTQAGINRRKKEGMYFTGQAPFGYQRVSKGRFELHPGQAETVARIFALAANSLKPSAATIARQLNAEGIPSAHGKAWTRSVIAALLRNPVYTGTVLYGRRQIPVSQLGGNGRHGAPQATLLAVQNAVPAIIDQDLFEKAHAAMTSRQWLKRNGSNRARDDYLLSGIARCRCGGSIGVMKSQWGTLYYRCANRYNGKGCPVHFVTCRADAVDERIAMAIQERFSGTRREEAMGIIRRQCESSSRVTEFKLTIRKVEQCKSRVESDLARLLRQARQGAIDPNIYADFKQDAENEQRELDARLAKLRTQLAAADSSAEQVERYRRVISAAAEWGSLPPPVRKELVRGLAKRLVLFYGGRELGAAELEVTWVG